MRTSSTSPSPIRRVSIRTPREAASAASAWPSPVVSLPSDSRTIRFWASSGKSAAARRRAAPMSVADLTGVEASRSISVSSAGSRSTSASLPNATIPATSPSGRSVERLAQEGERVLAARVADRIGEVDDEDGREPVDRQDQLEAGEREDERRQQERPDDERRPPSPRAHPPPRPDVEPDRSAAGPGSAGAARAARRTRCPSGAPVRGVPPEPGAEAAAQADQRVAVVDGPLDAQREEDEQDDRDPQLVACGRAGRGRRALAGRRSGRRGGRRRRRRAPRWRRPNPGRSSIHRRRRGRPRSGPGRSGRPAARATADRGARTRRDWRRGRRRAGGRPGPAPRRRGRRCRRQVRRDDVDARQVGPRERDARRQRGPGHELDDGPVGPRRRPARSHRPGSTRLTGVPGWTASVGAAEPPSSSPVRFASRIGKATWSGRSERRGSKARTAVGRPAREPGVEQGSALRARDDRPRPVGQDVARRRGDVGRRQVDVAQDRLIGVERADPRVGQRAGHLAERARGRRARWPGSAPAAASPAGRPRR